MKQFKPCVNKNACSEVGSHCLSCGRPLDEVYKTRELIEQLSVFVLDAEYENLDDFLAYLSKKVKAKVNYRLNQQQKQD